MADSNSQPLGKVTGICVSGGGIKSAAFACGVLNALAGLPLPESPGDTYPFYNELIKEASKDPKAAGQTNEEKQLGLKFLSQLDFLSAVSGGGFTATAYITFLRYFREHYEEAKMESSPTLVSMGLKNGQPSDYVAIAAVKSLYDRMLESCGFIVDRRSWLGLMWGSVRLVAVFIAAEVLSILPLACALFLGAEVVVDLFYDYITESVEALETGGSAGSISPGVTSILGSLYMWSFIAITGCLLVATLTKIWRKRYNLGPTRQVLKAVMSVSMLAVFFIVGYACIIPLVILLQTSQIMVLYLISAICFVVVLIFSLYNGLKADSLILGTFATAVSFGLLLIISTLVRFMIFDLDTIETWDLLQRYNFGIIVVYAIWGAKLRSILSDFYASQLERSFYCRFPIPSYKTPVAALIRVFNFLFSAFHVETPAMRYNYFHDPPSTDDRKKLFPYLKPSLILNAVVHDMYPIKKDQRRVYLQDKHPDPAKASNVGGAGQPKFGLFLMSTSDLYDGTIESKARAYDNQSGRRWNRPYFGAPDRLKPIDEPTITLSDALGVSGAAVSIANGRYEDKSRSRQIVSFFLAGGLGSWIPYHDAEVKEITYPAGSSLDYQYRLTYRPRFVLEGFVASVLEIFLAFVLMVTGQCTTQYVNGECPDGYYFFERLGLNFALMPIIALALLGVYVFWSMMPAHSFAAPSHSLFVRQALQMFRVLYEGPTNKAPGSYVYLSDGGHLENTGVFQLLRQQCDMIIMLDSGSDKTGGCEDLKAALDWARNELNCAFAPCDEDVARGIKDMDKAIVDFAFFPWKKRPFLKIKVFYPSKTKYAGGIVDDDVEQTFKQGWIYYVRNYKSAVPPGKKLEDTLKSYPSIPSFGTYLNPMSAFKALKNKIIGQFPEHAFWWQFFRPSDFLAYSGLGHVNILPVIRDMARSRHSDSDKPEFVSASVSELGHVTNIKPLEVREVASLD